ncbi:MAG: amidase [Candidatus Marinimicrobia bacterium]|nr:amidase [Candidatus Neomarinimicrobiota bacterium]
MTSQSAQPGPISNDPLNAFCKDSDAYLPGAAGGALAGLSFAAKDIFDVAGHVTGGGNPDWKATHQPAAQNAWVVEALTNAGATMAGKTLTDELTRGIFGENVHYGTPTNPRAPDCVPGGSSSGSASAVAGGLVDFALGSDTGGSVRVPASFCGLYGLRPTHGRIPLEGILLQAPSFDTIGWFARDLRTFARVGTILLGNPGTVSRFQSLIVAQDAFELADGQVVHVLQPLIEALKSLFGSSANHRLAPGSLADWSAHQQVLQGREAWESVRDWIEEVNPRFSFEVAERYTMAKGITGQEEAAAAPGRRLVVDRMDQILAGGGVVCLPTTVSPAPLLGQRVSDRHALRLRNSQLTSIAGLSGLPQISLPLTEVEGKPVGFSLMGPRGSDEALISLAQEFETALGR